VAGTVAARTKMPVKHLRRRGVHNLVEEGLEVGADVGGTSCIGI
jgi:hypothetical protein